MMALLASRHCAQAVVVALEYELEQQGNVSYWYWYSHVSRVSPAEDAIESLVGELEYRSSLVPFSLDRHAPSPSEGFGQWLAAQQAALREQLNVGIAETVNLTREALTPAAQRAVAVPIGALVSSVVCADCSKMDLLVKQSPSRVWLQPTGQSHLWRSLPVKG